MRTLKLSHSDIEMIEKALNAMYFNHLSIIERERSLLPQGATDIILSQANKYDDLRIEISGGTKDV